MLVEHAGRVWWRVKLDGSSAYIVPAESRRDGAVRLRMVPRSQAAQRWPKSARSCSCSDGAT